jgi:hypothetical protein
MFNSFPFSLSVILLVGCWCGVIVNGSQQLSEFHAQTLGLGWDAMCPWAIIVPFISIHHAIVVVVVFVVSPTCLTYPCLSQGRCEFDLSSNQPICVSIILLLSLWWHYHYDNGKIKRYANSHLLGDSVRSTRMKWKHIHHPGWSVVNQ